jgi:16S rRNA (adenine1518-N6/adenine1519-N6)-dimethyltransferase
MPLQFPTKQLIKKYGISPSRQRSQNFLIERSAAEKTVGRAQITAGDTVIEIGPGAGSLTYFLQAAAGRVICYEIDRTLHRILTAHLPPDGPVSVVLQDILTVDLAAATGGGSAVLIGSLPYAITSPILIKFFEASAAFRRAVFIVQKELAERLIAPPGCKEYGIFTLYCAAYCETAVSMTIPASCFYPVPGVDSAVIELVPRPEKNWGDTAEELFRTTVRSAFSQRRKTIQNCLKSLLGSRGIDVPAFKAAAEAEQLDLSRRAETFSVDEFYRLSRIIRRLSP